MTNELIDKAFELVDKKDINNIKIIISNYPELVNSESLYGSLLQEAVNVENKEIVKILVEKGADINYIGGLAETSILTDAANNGNLKIVRLLIESGVNLKPNTFASNALFAAIYNNHIEVAKFLIDNGIDITAKYDIGDIEGCDAMEYARQYGRTEIYEYLKEKMGK